MRINIIILITMVVQCKCTRMKGFVVDGSQADIHDFPYIAHLGISCIEIDKIEVYFCGSSILNQDLILTAAHCFFFCMDESPVTISIGHVKEKMGVVSAAESFHIHEEFSYSTVKNDIALVVTSTPIIFGDSISRVALMQNPPYDEEAQIAGWGFVNEQQKMVAEALTYTQQSVILRQKCVHQVPDMPKGTFCAGSRILRGYASVGDSGSPLVVRNFIQIGIVSFKKPDVSRDIVIYTDTGYFYKWITENANKLLCTIDNNTTTA